METSTSSSRCARTTASPSSVRRASPRRLPFSAHRRTFTCARTPRTLPRSRTTGPALAPWGWRRWPTCSPGASSSSRTPSSQSRRAARPLTSWMAFLWRRAPTTHSQSACSTGARASPSRRATLCHPWWPRPPPPSLSFTTSPLHGPMAACPTLATRFSSRRPPTPSWPCCLCMTPSTLPPPRTRRTESQRGSTTPSSSSARRRCTAVFGRAPTTLTLSARCRHLSTLLAWRLRSSLPSQLWLWVPLASIR
mmetsp:Transcript_15521/g.41627  ORF Transcript_15521/g.41627 Transcript_15521/m.41627 type:complete len:251 (+) Transcript_15521:1191-1943(+)